MISAGVDSQDLAKRGESLIRHSSNRYLTTVRIAFRAKQRHFDDFDGLLEDSMVKPVQRAIIEDSPAFALRMALRPSARWVMLRSEDQFIPCVPISPPIAIAAVTP